MNTMPAPEDTETPPPEGIEESETRVTEVVAAILRQFDANPEVTWWPYRMLRETCLSAGAVYPAFRRLEDGGWIERIPGPGTAHYRLVAARIDAVRRGLQAEAEWRAERDAHKSSRCRPLPVLTWPPLAAARV